MKESIQGTIKERKNERRVRRVDFSRRKFNRREKEFVYSKTVYLKDTNAMGNTYFSRYFEWQGEAREDFFKFLLPQYEEFLRSGVKLITIEASNKYMHESVLYDQVLVKLRILKVTPTAVDLGFDFINGHSGKTLALGKQKVAFADRDGKYILVPEVLREAAKARIVGLGI